MRLAEMIDRRQVGLAGNPPPPVPPTADGGHDDAGTVDVKIAHEKAAVRARVADADGDAARKGVLMLIHTTRTKLTREIAPHTPCTHTIGKLEVCQLPPPSPLPN